MVSKQRIKAVIEGDKADRTPVLGGWIANPAAICEIACIEFEEYQKDPFGVSLAAYRSLGTDASLEIFIPIDYHSYRFLDNSSYIAANRGMTVEKAINLIDEMPAPEKVDEAFDIDAEYKKFKQYMLEKQKIYGDILFMPAQWTAGAKVSWYFDFGYEVFFLLVGLYPEKARKLLELGGINGLNRSRIIARAVKEGIYPKAVLLGEDICTQRGPMIDPAFLEKYYAPILKKGLEPLVEAGCRPVWHCDGDCRKLLDMLLDCGIKGFQGFQPECDMRLSDIVQRKTVEGKPLLIFGPLAVTTELPVCTSAEIKIKVKNAVDICNGSADLVLFTSNTINPDVPVANIRAMYDAVKE